jgi:hypothetical protein
MNNEPVAWFEQDPDMKSVWYQADKDAPNAIPLYTHPAKTPMLVLDGNRVYSTAKTLTDEEIEEFAYAFELWQLNNPDKALEGIKDFARAILRKAQEK